MLRPSADEDSFSTRIPRVDGFVRRVARVDQERGSRYWNIQLRFPGVAGSAGYKDLGKQASSHTHVRKYRANLSYSTRTNTVLNIPLNSPVWSDQDTRRFVISYSFEVR